MIVIVMGVTGCGKTTIGAALARELGFEFVDADDFHSAANVAKMRAGIPLTDADRLPWLERLNALLRARESSHGGRVVLACSALKAAYREQLTKNLSGARRLVHLVGAKDLLATRLEARANHYMNPALLDSQLATLELPTNAISIDVAQPVDTIVLALRSQLEH